MQIGEMLRDWEREHPGRIDRMFRAMGNIVPSHLMDRNLYPFATLQPTGVADAEGDKAFDEDDSRLRPARRRRTPDRAAGCAPCLPRRPTEIRHDETIDAALVAAALALAGCAALNEMEAEVSSFSRWPAGRAPGDLRLRAAAVAAGQPATAADARGCGAARVEAAGFVPAAERRARRRQRADRRADHRHRASPYDDPFWSAPAGAVPGRLRPLRPRLLGTALGPYWGLRRWCGGPAYSPYYEREVAVLIRDRKTGEPLYEARANSEGAPPPRSACCRRCSAPR